MGEVIGRLRVGAGTSRDAAGEALRLPDWAENQQTKLACFGECSDGRASAVFV